MSDLNALNAWMEANKGTHGIHATDITLSDANAVHAALQALAPTIVQHDAPQNALWTLMRKRGIWAKIQRIARKGDAYLMGLGAGLTQDQCDDLVDNAETIISAQLDQGVDWEVHDTNFQSGLDALIALGWMDGQDKADIIALGTTNVPATVGMFGYEPSLGEIKKALMQEPAGREVVTSKVFTTHWTWADGSTTSASGDVNDHTLGS